MNILITGGNGGIAKGIKEAIQIYGLDKGYDNIYMCSKDEVDITNEVDVSTVMGKYKPDVIIHTAGYINPSALESTGITDFIKHFQVNTFGFINCVKYGLIHGTKIFINIGSTSSFEGRAEWGAYCSSKAATMSITETLAREGIIVYNVHPARTRTKMRDRLFPNESKTNLMYPKRVGEFVVKCINGEFKSGSHIIIKKNYYYVLPERECFK